ncbi:hypothetical protein [Lentzea sp. NPDC004782]|uniref:hypothetical protein n=1 Tax=Lentzea sp. NPDC004782 TaxID=3154458 RepID=UPI0033ABE536
MIDGDVHWSYWARRAIHRACKIWGGAGFAVVPHHDGKVHPTLLRACRAYDPDYVVNYHPTIGDLAVFAPEDVAFAGEEAEPLTSEQFDQMPTPTLAVQIPSISSEAARDQIAAVCSSYQSNVYAGWHEALTSLEEEDDSTNFTPITDLPGIWWAGSVLACPADWGGVLGAAIASHAGMAVAPSRSNAEPSVTDAVRIGLASWLLGGIGTELPNDLVWHPGVAVGVDTSRTPTANQRALTRLTEISSGPARHQTGVLVIGDTADDFALARLWRLTFGGAYWLPSVLVSTQEEIPTAVGLRVNSLARDLARRGGSLALTTISLSGERLQEAHERLSAADPIISPTAQKNALRAIKDGELSWKQNATIRQALQGRWDVITTIPVTVDDTLTTAMAAPLPPPVVIHPEFPHQANTPWHIDVSWRPGRAVRRRGIDSVELFAEPPVAMPTWTRSSRDGITYQAERFDFVAAGIRPENRLASVALRDLSLQAWVKVKGLEHGLDVRPSEAGRRAILLAKMLGGRHAFLELFGGPLLPALRAMLTRSSTTSTAYPDHQGVALSSSEGVLTFAGLCARSPDLTESDVRERIDAAARAGVVRRGLVLRCATCEQTQFMQLDRVKQRWTCQRCDASNDLDLWSWKAPTTEPMWFYDLHPVARHLLAENGDVPALLSRQLFNGRPDPRSPFDDAAEVVFTKDGAPQVEVDLVTYIDDTITVAECKSSGDDIVGRRGRSEVAKKCQAAAWLRADTLIFATKADHWSENSRTTIKSAVSNFSGWGPLGGPDVLLVSGLGAGEVHNEAL